MVKLTQRSIHMQTILALVAALWAIRCSGAYTEKYCSTLNTASISANYSNFQSNGLCDTFCDGYSYAILQDYACWCSDYTPAESTNVDLDDCDTECPGYPSDNCGGNNLYIYLFRNKTPAGTKGASSSSTTSTQTEVISDIPSPSITSSDIEPTSSTSPDQPVVQASEVGLSTGATVGISIGVVVVVLSAAGLLFFVWWKKRRAGRESYGDPSPRSSSAGMINGMASMTESGQQPGTMRGSKFIPIDERMEFHPDLYVRGEGNPSRESMSSLRDDVDYSRRVLRATNPDPPAQD